MTNNIRPLEFKTTTDGIEYAQGLNVYYAFQKSKQYSRNGIWVLRVHTDTDSNIAIFDLNTRQEAIDRANLHHVECILPFLIDTGKPDDQSSSI